MSRVTVQSRRRMQPRRPIRVNGPSYFYLESPRDRIDRRGQAEPPNHDLSRSNWRKRFSTGGALILEKPVSDNAPLRAISRGTRVDPEYRTRRTAVRDGDGERGWTGRAGIRRISRLAFQPSSQSLLSSSPMRTVSHRCSCIIHPRRAKSLERPRNRA